MSYRGGTRKIMIQGAAGTSGTLNDRFTAMKGTKIPHSPSKPTRGGKVLTRGAGGDRSQTSRGGHRNAPSGHQAGGSRGGSRGGRGGFRGGRGGSRGGRGGFRKREKTPTKEELDAELNEIQESNQMKE